MFDTARSLLRFAAVAALCCLGGSAGGSEFTRMNGLIAPGALQIDGTPVSCGSTPALISDGYPDYGAARPGLIILNPSRLLPLSPAARLLIYYHECAHQFVGRSELAADCWAVQKARRDGLLTRSGLQNACQFIQKLPANKHHPPGQLRCGHMARCFDDTFRARADAGEAVERAEEGATSHGFSDAGDETAAP